MKAYRVFVSLFNVEIADAQVDDLNDIVPILEYEADRHDTNVQALELNVCVRSPEACDDGSND